MNIDLSNVSSEPIEVGGSDFQQSLGAVLERVGPLAANGTDLTPEERIRRLGAAINLVLDTLEELTGMGDPNRLPNLIEHVGELAVTGDNVEVQIGVAGDLRVDKRHRLDVEGVLYSFQRVPQAMRPAAHREGINTLQRLLALLLLQGWSDSMHDSKEARQAARLDIVDTVQGRLYAGRAAL